MKRRPNLSQLKSLLLPGLYMAAGRFATRGNMLDVSMHEKFETDELEVRMWCGGRGPGYGERHTFTDPINAHKTLIPIVSAMAERVTTRYDEALRAEYGM